MSIEIEARFLRQALSSSLEVALGDDSDCRPHLVGVYVTRMPRCGSHVRFAGSNGHIAAFTEIPRVGRRGPRDMHVFWPRDVAERILRSTEDLHINQLVEVNKTSVRFTGLGIVHVEDEWGHGDTIDGSEVVYRLEWGNANVPFAISNKALTRIVPTYDGTQEVAQPLGMDLALMRQAERSARAGLGLDGTAPVVVRVRQGGPRDPVRLDAERRFDGGDVVRWCSSVMPCIVSEKEEEPWATMAEEVS